MTKIAPFEMSLLSYLLMPIMSLSHCVRPVRVVTSKARVLDLVGLECQENNRPFSGQQHQAQFGLNPALSRRLST